MNKITYYTLWGFGGGGDINLKFCGAIFVWLVGVGLPVGFTSIFSIYLAKPRMYIVQPALSL